MVWEIKKLLGFGGVNTNYTSSPKTSQCIPFRSNSNVDTFQSTTINRYTSESAIIEMIKRNPEIMKILKSEGVQLELNIKDLKNLLNTHCNDTRETAKGIIENLPFGLKERVNSKSINEAAYLHDIGKVLIPKEILNKKGKLTPKETKIMHLHSQLGYELLKTTDIDTRTLNLIRYHHQNQLKNGYPKVQKDFNADLDLQIIAVADKYSALCEKRSYKEAMPKAQALGIIYQDVKDGKVHPLVFKALVDSVNKPTILQKQTV